MAVDYQKEGRIAIITINRPEAMNALNADVRREMDAALSDVRDDNDIWVAVITGAGEKAFCAGADLKEMNAGNVEAQRGSIELVRADRIMKPFIAAINGYALGGGLELALTCDLRIAAEHARFGQPEILRGFIPGGGATQRLPRFIPRVYAAEILLMPKHVTAQEAYHMGLINKVVPLAQLMTTAMEWAQNICQAAPLGVRTAKEAMLTGYGLPLEDGLKFERLLRRNMPNTEDFKEGVKAFAEKRKPEWKGR
ncbi:MAG: enoyl-CoA hydratase-related protein [Dehalococcoidales bacterium]|nr:enoyl-CoA hydratase-related protein [Dehalococcoidales bacterium]